MSAYEELLAAVKHVRDHTDHPHVWQTGLVPNGVAAVITSTTRSEHLGAIRGKSRRQHSDLFGTGPPGGPPTGWPSGIRAASSDREEGIAAEAIASAEAALAQQNSASARLDMQVISAILNAHVKTVGGGEALTKLQRETEAAVRTRSDLDTAAGARDFQRFLIGKLRDIRAVVLNANLDDTSKSALMAAWTSLYDASKSEPKVPGEYPPALAVPDDVPARGTTEQIADGSGTEWDPLLDALLAGDAGLPEGGPSGQGPARDALAPPIAPVTPTIPNCGGPLPGLGVAPGSMAGWGADEGLPLPGLRGGGRTDPGLEALDDEGLLKARDPDLAARASVDEPGNQQGGDEDHDQDATVDEHGSLPAGPTAVALPDGETVVAASPQLAAAIGAAVGGEPIADAFRQQGITIPPPGTTVADPIDPMQVTPGDVGIFTDRHALALGPGKALLDGQIQHIATVSGPSFLGWEHPPAATTPTATGPAKPDTPTPTRPATSSTT